MRILKNKKGNFTDIFDYMIIAFGLGIVILIMAVFLLNFDTTINTIAQNNTMINDSVALGKSAEVLVKFTVWDFVIPILFIFFLGFSVWSARRIPSTHKFSFLFIPMMIMIIFFSFFIESGWQLFTELPIISAIVGNWKFTNFFLEYLKYFAIIYGLFVGVALYAKKD